MDNEKIARDFMDWYGANMDRLRYYVKDYDEDLFTEAFLRAYNAILRRGTVINDYTGYFLRTYRATFLDSKKAPDIRRAEENELLQIRDTEFNSDLYEEVVETLNTEVLEYVRDHYDPLSTSLFEIYLGLFPEMSYAKLSIMLGISEPRIKQRVGPIKKDVAVRFGNRKGFLMSLV